MQSRGLEADWGFSALIEGTEKTILFDTGTKPEVLIGNMEKLKIDFQKPEVVIISHNHTDHTGGLDAFLARNHAVTVLLPASAPEEFVNEVKSKASGVLLKQEPFEVCKGVFLTGEMGTAIKEQSIVFDMGDGIVVMTGCAHPGIVEIIGKSKQIVNKDVLLVFGGFHLLNYSDEQMNAIIDAFRKLGVQKCGATHCTGESQIERFRREYGNNFVELGAGRVLTFVDGKLADEK